MGDVPEVRTYDSKEVTPVVDGMAITGAAEGSWITAERSEDNFTEHVGAQGEVALAETNNFTGEITITLDATSPSNDYLYALSRRRGQNAIVPVVIVDANDFGGIRISASQARVRRPANYEAGAEITQREWVFFCADIEFADRI